MSKFDAYVAFGPIAEEYGKQYGTPDFSSRYPANLRRMELTIALCEAIKPRSILDVGCGTAEPMIELLKRGHKVTGFDLAPEMVKFSKQHLREAGFSEDLVQLNDMEHPKGFALGSHDCIIGLGIYPYARDFNGAVKRGVDILPSGGHFIISLRNDLFSMYSLNTYSEAYFKAKLFPMKMLSSGLRADLESDLSKIFSHQQVQKKVRLSVDDQNVHSVLHNPLTVKQDIAEPAGCDVLGVYYYHFHALPPKFEHTNVEEFRRLSWEMEKPDDWRGLFMASAFVVHLMKR